MQENLRGRFLNIVPTQKSAKLTSAVEQDIPSAYEALQYYVSSGYFFQRGCWVLFEPTTATGDLSGASRDVGIVSKGEALQMADKAELDLVILSPDADPPVVRIMDYK
ncbi:Translation initiation factor [Forsythia ovata]|uniref:Translation initiation factor n=1 Tax=Forsythia ovata TaxID=205694 RepID=A0ABD1PKH3_9LAMI